MSELRQATIRVGNAGLNGTGLTGPEKTDITNRLTALEAEVVPTVLNDLTDVDTTTTPPVTGDRLEFDGTNWVPYTPAAITVTSATAYVIDGGGAVIASGVKGELPPFPFAGTITGLSLTADQSGTISVELWMDTMTNFPPTVADQIDVITLSAATRSPTSGSYNTESHAFSAGHVLRFNVTSTATSITRVTLGVRYTHEVGP